MTNFKTEKLILATGGTGFVGVHCILQLLEKDYKVKTTLLSLGRKNEVLEMLKVGGLNSLGNTGYAKPYNTDCGLKTLSHFR